MENIILEEGMKAPDFILPGSDEKDHKLSDYLGKKVVLYFYPRDNTPGCSREAEAFRDNAEEFNKNNAVILGVSRDTIASHNKFIAKYKNHKAKLLSVLTNGVHIHTISADSQENLDLIIQELKDKNFIVSD